MACSAGSVCETSGFRSGQPLTPNVRQAMSPNVLDKYAALAGVGSHSHNFLAKGATRVHDAVLGCDQPPPPTCSCAPLATLAVLAGVPRLP